MSNFLTPGYVRWDGLKFVTDPTIEIVGPPGPPGPQGPPGNISGPASGDLSGFYPDPTVVGLQTNPVASGVLTPAYDGYLLTWDGYVWEALPPPPPPVVPVVIPSRDLMLSLNASKGMYAQFTTSVPSGYSPGFVPITWRDQATTRYGRSWLPTGAPMPPLGTGINGLPTTEWDGLYSDNPDPVFFETVSPANTNYIYSQNELSIATVAKYTGSLVVSPNGTYIIPAYSINAPLSSIIGEATGGGPWTAGLMGGQYAADGTKMVFLAYIYTGTNGNPWSITNWKYVISAPVLKSAAHYAVMTFGLGVLSLYVDALPPVTASGIGPIAGDNFVSPTNYIQIGGCSGSGFGTWTGSILEVDAWNVCLTPDEVATTQAWLKLQGGF
jgi:hypothetical protein